MSKHMLLHRQLTFAAVELDDVQRQSNLLKRIVFLANRYATLYEDLTEERRCVPVRRRVEGGLLGQGSEPVQNSDNKG